MTQAAGLSREEVGRFALDVASLAGPGDWRFGIAFSGGPDSLALLRLSQAAFPGRVAAATVDHRLRPESDAEARVAARQAEAIGVPHAILAPEAPITGNIQSAARAARYALLEGWRAKSGLDWILTAHHADDQAETLVMRLNRGSGLAGLAGIRPVQGRLLRPLLGWRRSALAAIAAGAPFPPIEDPSNADPRFDRARIRARLAACDLVEPLAWSRSARFLAEAEEGLAFAVDRLAEERIRRTPDGLSLDPTGLPPALRRALVLRLLAEAGENSAPRGEAVDRLIGLLAAGRTATLAGLRATARGDLWLFAPAPPRRGTGDRLRRP